MKEINMNTLQTEDKQGVLNEIRLLASLDSDQLVGYKDAFWDERSRTLCIITEQAEHGDVDMLIKRHKAASKAVDEKEIWKIISQALKGLRDLHKQNIIHRDIKPANLLVCKHKNVKLADLNVSTILKNDKLAQTQVCTPYQCPPEIWTDKPYDSKCDIWSLGIVAYELCTGCQPFRADSMVELANKVSKGEFAPIPSLYSHELTHMINSMLTINPKQRPSAKELTDRQLFDDKTI